MKKLLLISHDGSLTGAPILLLNLAIILKEKGFIIDFVFANEGILEQECRRIGKVTVINRTRKSYVGKTTNVIRRSIQKRRLKASSGKYDMILSNTITNGQLYPYLSQRIPVVTYVHELPYAIHGVTNEADLKNVFNSTKLFLSPSMAVEENLSKAFSIDKKMMLRLPYYIPDYFEKKKPARETMRKDLGFSNDDFIVGSMGTMHWRKGNDFFLFVANKIAASGKKIKFVWCGGRVDDVSWLGMQIDIEKMGLREYVKLIPTISDSWKMMACFDMFFLSSREDPYPLVVLEAAMMEVPIVCLQKSGGAPEFIEKDAGLIVPYLDINKAADAILLLQEDREFYTLAATTARKKYLMHHSREIVSERFNDMLKKFKT